MTQILQIVTILSLEQNLYVPLQKDCPHPKFNSKTLDKSSQRLKRTGNTENMRDTYKYKLFDGNQLVYIGITNDLERREAEHKSEGKVFSRMEQIGYATTREAAEIWEELAIAEYKLAHNGERPKYDQNDSGK